MTRPLVRPPRKNPVLRTRVPTPPPGARSRVALGLTAAAARGRFELQVCRDCGATQYPPREACSACLSQRLDWRPQDGLGELISDTTLRHSNEVYYRDRMPWRLGMVRLDCGPIVIAHLHGDCRPAPSRVRVQASLDRAGQAALFAIPEKDTPHMTDDPQLREMTCDPKFRKVLVTDAKTPVGQALVHALATAGADLIWAGHAEPWKKSPGFERLSSIPQVSLLPLDLTDSRAVKDVAGEIGGRVDILINTADHHRTFGIAARQGVDVARAEMDVNYFGLLRLAQEFAPAMRVRGADGQSSAVAFVNLLSIFALSNFPAHGTYSASKAAALSLAQCLRAELGSAGVRVINVFPGPIDDEWNQALPPPKLAPERLAAEIVEALRSGAEDVFPGDIAQEWLARWRDNPKALERELSAQAR
jgi:NAD(P)-dependent dehydrogenase (short-subunit alcohol dehydrogenase family)/uncharacterized OB-fold protein